MQTSVAISALPSSHQTTQTCAPSSVPDHHRTAEWNFGGKLGGHADNVALVSSGPPESKHSRPMVYICSKDMAVPAPAHDGRSRSGHDINLALCVILAILVWATAHRKLAGVLPKPWNIPSGSGASYQTEQLAYDELAQLLKGTGCLST